jgi:hypothetical protein
MNSADMYDIKVMNTVDVMLRTMPVYRETAGNKSGAIPNNMFNCIVNPD